MSGKEEAISVIACCIAVVALVVGPVFIIVTNATERTKACVQSGGSYVHVAETSTMECKR